VYQLVDQGLLTRTTGDRPGLQLSEDSRAVLRGERQVRLLESKQAKTARSKRAALSLVGVDEGLADVLRDLRRQIARERGVPPYVIFHDTTLMDLARIRPSHVGGLLGIHGLGAKKSADLGAALVGTIQGYCTQHKLAMDQA
jgi:ATP-dependent DNA helicase RecQ